MVLPARAIPSPCISHGVRVLVEWPFDERGIAISDQRDGTPMDTILEVDSTDVSVRFKAAANLPTSRCALCTMLCITSREKMPSVIPCMVRRLTALCQKMKWLQRQF